MDYCKVAGGSSAGALCALPQTGMTTSNIVYLILAAVLMLSIGGALLRFLPKKEH